MSDEEVSERAHAAAIALCEALDALDDARAVAALNAEVLVRVERALGANSRAEPLCAQHPLFTRLRAALESKSAGDAARSRQNDQLQKEDRTTKTVRNEHEQEHSSLRESAGNQTQAALQTQQAPSAPESVDNSAPSLPPEYVVPEVWTGVQDSGADTGLFGAMNQPNSGTRELRELDIGQHPYQLYSIGTANGIRAAIAFEELGVEYDAWYVDIMQREQFASGLVELNPNAKVPALRVVSGAALASAPAQEDTDFRVFESAHILLHLAETFPERGLLPVGKAKRAECLNWLFWSATTTPLIGFGFGHFYRYAPIKIAYAIDRCTVEVKRQLSVLEQQLFGRTYVLGDELSIADICIFPWVYALDAGYKAAAFLRLNEYPNVARWTHTMLQRPAVRRGIRVNGFAPDAIRGRHSPGDFQAA